MIDKINNYNIDIQELIKQKNRLQYENQQSRKWGINIYNANRKLQSIEAQIMEYDLLEYIARKPNISEIYYINEYNNRSYKNIDEYIQNELNKTGVDIIIRTTDQYYKCDMKCMRYSKYMGTNPITVVDTIPIQVLNYNNLEGWGVNPYKISDFIIVYIPNKCYIKINHKELVKWLKPRLNQYKWIQCKKGVRNNGDQVSEYIVNVKLEDIRHFTVIEDIRNINI